MFTLYSCKRIWKAYMKYSKIILIADLFKLETRGTWSWAQLGQLVGQHMGDMMALQRVPRPNSNFNTMVGLH